MQHERCAAITVIEVFWLAASLSQASCAALRTMRRGILEQVLQSEVIPAARRAAVGYVFCALDTHNFRRVYIFFSLVVLTAAGGG